MKLYHHFMIEGWTKSYHVLIQHKMGILQEIISVVLITSTIMLILVQQVNALTQFYFAIPRVIGDTKGITLSVYIGNRVFSWVDNGTDITPSNNTPNIQPDDRNIDLQENEYLLAINDNVDIGTRVYMCVDFPRYFADPICQTDAIDKHHLARSAFQFLFK